MPSLFETISARLQQTPDARSPEVDQEQIQRALRAKGGQAGMGGGPAASRLQEASAQQQAQAGLRQGAFAGGMAAAQLTEQARAQEAQAGMARRGLETEERMAMSGIRADEQRAAGQRQAAEEQARSKRTAEENMRLDAMEAQSVNKLRELEASRQVTLDDIFGQFQAENKLLADRRDAADLEQLGFQLAMSDRAYMDELNRIGRERRLQNDQSFEMEMRNIIFGDDLAGLLEDMNYAVGSNAQQREWEKNLANMSAEHAREIANSAIQAQAKRQAIEGIANITGKAAAGYGERTGSTPTASSAGGAVGPSSAGTSMSTSMAQPETMGPFD